MTWTKLGEEWPDAARELTDAAFRTHIEALCWSNRRGLDLLLPKRELKRFAETDDSDTAVKDLVAAGWWEDRGDAWFIGVQFPDWQLERRVVEHRREQSALTSRRHRLHEVGDHSICLSKNCRDARQAKNPKAGDASHEASHHASRERSPGTVRNGSERYGAEIESSAVDVDQGGRGEGGPGGEPHSAPNDQTLPPPTFPDHCPWHAHDSEPPPCRGCQRTREERERQVSLLDADRADAGRPWRPDWCGDCDEKTRQLDTDDGVRRCPVCHPLAVSR